MVIAIASGKGGTGKTSVAVSLALSAGRCRLVDCDVEEPDVHLLLKPQVVQTRPVTSPVPRIDESLCNRCGECSRACAFHALATLPNSVLVFRELCHGCGLCAWVCPRKAITETGRELGVLEIGRAGEVDFIAGRLNEGEPMAVPVIKAARGLAEPGLDTIIDAPPGTSCPVVAAVSGADCCLLVTEPTPFGLHDLTLAVDTLRRLKLRFGVIINRCDIGDDRVEQYCARESIPVLLRIPEDRAIAEAYSRGLPLTSARPDLVPEFARLWQRLRTGELP